MIRLFVIALASLFLVTSCAKKKSDKSSRVAQAQGQSQGKADPKVGEAKPGETKPGDVKPGDSQPGDGKVDDAAKVQAPKTDDPKIASVDPILIKPGGSGGSQPRAAGGRGETPSAIPQGSSAAVTADQKTDLVSPTTSKILPKGGTEGKPSPLSASPDRSESEGLVQRSESTGQITGAAQLSNKQIQFTHQNGYLTANLSVDVEKNRASIYAQMDAKSQVQHPVEVVCYGYNKETLPPQKSTEGFELTKIYHLPQSATLIQVRGAVKSENVETSLESKADAAGSDSTGKSSSSLMSQTYLQLNCEGTINGDKEAFLTSGRSSKSFEVIHVKVGESKVLEYRQRTKTDNNLVTTTVTCVEKLPDAHQVNPLKAEDGLIINRLTVTSGSRIFFEKGDGKPASVLPSGSGKQVAASAGAAASTAVPSGTQSGSAAAVSGTAVASAASAKPFVAVICEAP